MQDKADMTTLRERYLAGEILKVGEVVEDVQTGEQLKIIDRGSNYVTVVGKDGQEKKWLNEVKEAETKSDAPDFTITESGQIALFGYETKHFDLELAESIVEQFDEFDDMYSKHQIVKCLDIALNESEDLDRRYSVLESIEGFYTKQSTETPLIVEGLKDGIERKRIVSVIASVAGVELKDSLYETMEDSINAFKEKYKEKKQWLVLVPFLRVAKSMGVANAMVGLPFGLSNVTKQTNEEIIDQKLVDLLENNVNEIFESIDLDDVVEGYDDEYNDEGIQASLVMETLTLQGRRALARNVRTHSTQLTARRERAERTAASTTVIQNRARKLALAMIKKRIFRKKPSEMTRQEKERFEAGASRRKALVARLAQRLVSQVRAIQNARLHQQHQSTSQVHQPQQPVASGAD